MLVDLTPLQSTHPISETFTDFFNSSEDHIDFILHKTSFSLLRLNTIELASQEREVKNPTGKRGKEIPISSLGFCEDCQ